MGQYLKLFRTEADYEAASDKPDVAHIIEDVGIIVKDPIDFNGHEYVDLGLPSGILWAKCNVGTDSESGYGGYYMYGKGSKAYNKNEPRYSATTEVLPLEVDTARIVMGGDWKMPTKEQTEELERYTTKEYDFVINRVKGIKLTSTINGNYVFFPYAGNYYLGRLINRTEWAFFMTSTASDISNTAHYGATVNYFSNTIGGGVRNDSLNIGGYSVRGVIEIS